VGVCVWIRGLGYEELYMGQAEHAEDFYCGLHMGQMELSISIAALLGKIVGLLTNTLKLCSVFTQLVVCGREK
jgi:hypothetical protein